METSSKKGIAVNDLAALKKVLDAQCNVYEKLLELEGEKTQALVSGDTQALLHLMNAQQALLMQSKGLETQRIGLCSDTKCATLREMIKSSKECQSTLEPVYETLRITIGALKKKNALNKKLVDTRLATIHFMNRQLGLDENSGTYSKTVQTSI